jgi:hypothetical protein
MMVQGQRYQPLPIVQAGGVQPYTSMGGRMPGPSLLAMLRGSTFAGFNPQDAQRKAQTMGQGSPLLLSMLLRR